MLDRVADAARDRRRVAVAVGVEHAHRHDLRAVGQPGQPEPVVGRLGDHPRDERPMALAIERERVVRDKVVGVDEVGAGEVGRLAEASQFRYATPVSSTAMTTPRPPGRWSANMCPHASGASMPAPGRKFHWSSCHPGRDGCAGIVGDPAGGVGDVVGDRVGDATLAAQPRDHLPDARRRAARGRPARWASGWRGRQRADAHRPGDVCDRGGRRRAERARTRRPPRRDVVGGPRRRRPPAQPAAANVSAKTSIASIRQRVRLAENNEWTGKPAPATGRGKSAPKR